MSTDSGPIDVTRMTLAVLLIAVLIASCLWIMKPFLSALIWATMIVVATWPQLLSIQKRLGGRRWLAALFMTLLLLVILIVPLTLAIYTLVEKAQELFAANQSLADFIIPPPPEWLRDIPLVGEKTAAKWQELLQQSHGDLAEKLAPYSKMIVSWFLVQAGSIGKLILHCVLTVVVVAILYVHGDDAAAGVVRFARRIAGNSGENATLLAAKAVRGVAVGIVGTALAQSVLSGFSLVIAGIPAPLILTAVVFFFCAAQLGPVPVLLPATVWLFVNDRSGWGIFLLVWTVMVTTIDNFLRPYLIRRGADLPLLLVFAGVLGGLISFGILGLFIGPVMLAVTYTLLKEWVVSGEDDRRPEGDDSLGSGDEREMESL